MTDLHRESGAHLYEVRARHNTERFNQLNGLLNSGTQSVWTYLMSVNGGGAAGMLAFIGAKDSIASQVWPYVVLGLFTVGLILVGIAHAVIVHKVQALIDNWNAHMSLYWQDRIGWSVVLAKDKEVVARQKAVPWILGWLALVLFLAGVAAAAYGFRSAAGT